MQRLRKSGGKLAWLLIAKNIYQAALLVVAYEQLNQGWVPKNVNNKSGLQLCLLLFVVTITTGCASLLGSPIHNVRIDSTPQNAQFSIVDEQGEQVAEGVTPDLVKLHTSGAPFKAARYYVNFNHKDYPVKTESVKGRISGYYYLNIFFGYIGALIYDPYTGAMYKLPDEISSVLSDQSNTSETEPTTQLDENSDVAPKTGIAK